MQQRRAFHCVFLLLLFVCFFFALKKKLIFRDISIAVALQIVFRTFHITSETVTSTMAVCRDAVH